MEYVKIRQSAASYKKRIEEFKAAKDGQKAAMDEIEKWSEWNKQLEESSRIERDDLRRKNALLQEELEKAKRENEVLVEERRKAEEERRKTEEERRKTEEERRKAKEERCKVEEDMKKVTAEAREAHEATAAAEGEVVKLRKKTEEILETFRAGKDNLAAPQRQPHISDIEVASQFTHLFEQIKCWVDDEIWELRSLEELEAIVMNQHRWERLGCLSVYLEPAHMLLAGEPVRDELIILCCLIHCHLERSILNETLSLFGIEDQKTALHEEIEPAMTAPQYATTTERRRRVLLKARYNTEEFQKSQRAQADEFSLSLYSALSRLLPKWHDKGDALGKLHKRITIPAVQLAMSIRLSTATYRMFRGRSPGSVVYEEDMQRYIIKDLVTHRTLTPAIVGNVPRVERNGRIGEKMLMGRPGLQRCRDDYRHEIVLCKPLIFVQLDTRIRESSRLNAPYAQRKG